MASTPTKERVRRGELALGETRPKKMVPLLLVFWEEAYKEGLGIGQYARPGPWGPLALYCH